MKFLDFTSLLAGAQAQIAFFSTFQFDPDFFERRLLRCSMLARARRIVVFIDARQWYHLLKKDVYARQLNRRYLVVPVSRGTGVFHPKLSLILNPKGGQVLCGSNNLTRTGCASNLELLNAVPFDFEDSTESALALAKETLGFFTAATEHTDPQISQIVNKWISETISDYPRLNEPVDETNGDIQLVHTYKGSIWDRFVEVVDPLKPKKFLIVSPFHDKDAGMCRRLLERWPQAKVEFIVQPHYTTLPITKMKDLERVSLSEIKDSSRRLHAKLVAWTGPKGSGCLVGSANFTSAAFDGRNVEASLLMQDTDGLIDSLFDRQLQKKALSFSDFNPGFETSPEETDTTELPSLRIKSALITETGQLVVSYAHKMDEPPISLHLEIRGLGERHPKRKIKLTNVSDGTYKLVLEHNALNEVNEPLLANLLADLDGKKISSSPVWIIEERRLTYEPGEGSSATKSTVEETGHGLTEFLEELRRSSGARAVATYLQQLNIRFYDGNKRLGGTHKFRLKIRDPYLSDSAPEWLTRDYPELEETIYDFVDRHTKKKLLKHANRGNINGMENFLDIFTTCVRLLYVFYKRNIVKKPRLISRMIKLLETATAGKDTGKEIFDGYLYAVWDNLGGDVSFVQERCDEVNYLAEVRAALVIVQDVRFDPEESENGHFKVSRARDVLPTTAKMIEDAIYECDLNEPEVGAVRRALEQYQMFSDNEISRLVRELPALPGNDPGPSIKSEIPSLPADNPTEVLIDHDQNDSGTAIAHYTESLRKSPDDFSAYYNRAISYRELGMYAEAIADFTEAIRISPDNADVYCERGVAYSENGEYDNAIADYMEAIRIKPDCADSYYNCGVARGEKGEYDQEIADYTEAIRINPSHGDAYNNRGVAYSKKGNAAKAKADFAKADELG